MPLVFEKKHLAFFITPILIGLIFYLVPLNIFEARADVATISVSVEVTSICGNDSVEGDEQCDGSDLGGQTCVSLGYYGGTLACKADCTFDTSGCTTVPPPSPPAGGAPTPPPPVVTKVVLQGKAYPLASITVLQDGKVATVIKADSGANFKVEITNITAGVYTFGLWAEDKEGRRSITFSFTVTVTSGRTTTVSGIFIPPTIELDKVNVLKGEILNIFGQTASESKITISVESPEIVKTTKAEKDGDWKYPFDTSPLDEGSHTTRAKAESPEGLKSSYSKVLAFYVGKYTVAEIAPKADFNKDGKTNLIDFSIMLYWWGKYNPAIDQNRDGIVNLPDFSILMYYWTG